MSDRFAWMRSEECDEELGPEMTASILRARTQVARERKRGMKRRGLKRQGDTSSVALQSSISCLPWQQIEIQAIEM
jgi:hypothetical protein